MTRKDYIKRAKVLRNNKPFISNKYGEFDDLIADFLDMLFYDNSRFDMKKFIEFINNI